MAVARPGITDATVIKMSLNIDWDEHSLSNEESFLMSRLEGNQTTVADLAEFSSMPADRCLEMVDRLVQIGVLLEVKGLEARLGLPETTGNPEEAAKQRESARAARLEEAKLRRRMAQNPHLAAKMAKGARHQIDGARPALPEKAGEHWADPERDKEGRLNRLEKTQRKRRLAKNPMIQRLEKARDLFKLAEQSYAENRLQEAAGTMRIIKSFGIQDNQILERAEDIIREANVERAGRLMERAERYAQNRKWETAARFAVEIVKLASGNSKLLERSVYMIERAEGETVDIWEQLLAIYERRKEWHQALRASEEILKIRPVDGEIRKKREDFREKVANKRDDKKRA